MVDVEEEAGSQETIKEHILRPGQASAFVSIMQGCNMHCTFCIVPATRGAERSRRPEEIVAEVRSALWSAESRKSRSSARSSISTDATSSRKSADGRSPFVQLLDAVHAVDGLERLRFTSPHPIGFRQDLVDAFARLPRLMPHVHFPMQSGSDRILRAMHRPYTSARYLDLDRASARRPSRHGDHDGHHRRLSRRDGGSTIRPRAP